MLQSFHHHMYSVPLWLSAKAFADKLERTRNSTFTWGQIKSEYFAVKRFSHLVNKTVGVRMIVVKIGVMLYVSYHLANLPTGG